MISVIIPVKNDEKNIRAAVESVLQQKTREKFEVIVINNNSTDNTVKAISDLKIKILKEMKPSASAVRNRGIRNAKGSLLLFTDSDCVVSKDWMNTHIAAQKSNDVVLGRMLLHPDYRKSITAKTLEYGLLPYFDFYLMKRGYVDFWNLYTPNLSVKKKVFEKVGLFDESFKYAGSEDTEFGFRLRSKGVSIFYEPKAVVFHKHKKGFKSAMKRAIMAGRQAKFLATKTGANPRRSVIFKRLRNLFSFKELGFIDKVLILFFSVVFIFGFLYGSATVKKLYP
jgi:glycosyltransferase involved in cell wall biosynthesis